MENVMLTIGHWILDLARRWSTVKIAIIACIGVVIGAIPVILLGASSAVFIVSMEIAVLLLMLYFYARFRVRRIDNLLADVDTTLDDLRSEPLLRLPDSELDRPPLFPPLAWVRNPATGQWERTPALDFPPNAQITIHQIGTPEPVGWFDSKSNWIEAPPQGQHEEMLLAAADWRQG